MAAAGRPPGLKHPHIRPLPRLPPPPLLPMAERGGEEDGTWGLPRPPSQLLGAVPLGSTPPGDGPRLGQSQLSGCEPEPEPEPEAREGDSDLGSEPQPQPMEEHFDGVLDEDTVAEALYKLGRSAPGAKFVYLNLSLSGCNLSDISILSRYIHLEKLELSYNKINDLSCVSHMPYLLELDASNNELTTYFDFKPPKNLKEVDFSYNQISEMQDLSTYQSLTKLTLDHNNIEEIKGLEKCHSLTYLSLAHNRITTISGLKNLPIKILCLCSNQIEKITGLEDLKVLQNLDLSSNKISSLEGLEEHDLLEVINLENNQISELGELEYLEDLPLLRVFNLLRNPVQEQTEYWLLVIFMLLQLTELDHRKIKVEEKVAAVNKYDPPPEVVAAKDHMTHIMYSMIQPQRIFDSTLPSLDAPYPMLILVGPMACGKRELSHRICRQFNNFFRYSPCHTTRASYFGEDNRLDYYFISQEVFDNMLNMGKFIATYKYSSHYYGLGRDTVESIAREGLASCVHLEIEGVQSLKNTYFEPRYILLVPMNKEKYERHLRRKGLFSRPEIETAVSRVDMYIKINQDFPGYFDAVINTDDYDEAYTQLSLLIKEYLGIVQPSDLDSSRILDNKAVTDSNSLSFGDHKALTSGGTVRIAQSSDINEFSDSSARNYSVRISAKLATQKTPVEKASLQRRQHAARQALLGKAPSAYAQLFQRHLASTPAAISPHGLLEPTSYISMLPSGSNVTQDRSLPPASPDTRSSKMKNRMGSRESHATTGLSIMSSAGAFSTESLSARSPVPNAPYSKEANAECEDAGGVSNGMESLKDAKLSSDMLEKKPSKSKSSSPRVPQLANRPGSNSKPVLPPIPSGRKKTNP
ncbi:leucine-rich repeat and guanylate kinase domain-containing protein isoform X2 [Dermochelys coriacea]|uniref:leucine-rich repeat and guanylate kinase domain-containing protein isoform X2 n=1 Tax=Dermochelys coriacea TaxID=27794 RepID=UPI001CA958FF|nr:leucine-rich repeat and guanylate kinase domain-containing protein isoform X2 [Dermochelys coriacea]